MKKIILCASLLCAIPAWAQTPATPYEQARTAINHRYDATRQEWMQRFQARDTAYLQTKQQVLQGYLNENEQRQKAIDPARKIDSPESKFLQQHQARVNEYNNSRNAIKTNTINTLNNNYLTQRNTYLKDFEIKLAIYQQEQKKRKDLFLREQEKIRQGIYNENPPDKDKKIQEQLLTTEAHLKKVDEETRLTIIKGQEMRLKNLTNMDAYQRKVIANTTATLDLETQKGLQQLEQQKNATLTQLSSSRPPDEVRDVNELRSKAQEAMKLYQDEIAQYKNQSQKEIDNFLKQQNERQAYELNNLQHANPALRVAPKANTGYNSNIKY